jgi:acyloxyacyl hydrolase
VDHDCNGIFGVNPNTGNSYEDELCAGTNPYGVIVIGDSAGTQHIHFNSI